MRPVPAFLVAHAIEQWPIEKTRPHRRLPGSPRDPNDDNDDEDEHEEDEDQPDDQAVVREPDEEITRSTARNANAASVSLLARNSFRARPT